MGLGIWVQHFNFGIRKVEMNYRKRVGKHIKLMT